MWSLCLKLAQAICTVAGRRKRMFLEQNGGSHNVELAEWGGKGKLAKRAKDAANGEVARLLK